MTQTTLLQIHIQLLIIMQMLQIMPTTIDQEIKYFFKFLSFIIATKIKYKILLMNHNFASSMPTI